MKTIIAGSRKGTSRKDITFAIALCGWVPSEVVSGTALGADKLGELWAAEHKVPVRKYPANWDLHGRSAGYIRNAEMADAAEALIALWDGESRGTKHMIDLATKKGLRVYVYDFILHDLI